MPLYAVERLDDAFDATRALFLPLDVGRWLRLAVVAFFLGGGTAAPVNYSFGGGVPPTPAPGRPEGIGFVPPPDAALSQTAVLVVVAVVVLAVLLGLLVLAVASVMEFVFVESLVARDVRVRRYFRRHFGRGMRLFGFRLALGLVGLAVFGTLVALVVVPAVTGAGAALVPLLVVVVPVMFALGVVFAVVYGFTSAFVVPVMLAEDRGVLSAWRRFWPTLRTQWRQYLVYAVAAFILNVAAGLVVGVAVAVPAIVLAVVLGIPAAVVFFALGTSPAALVVLGFLALAFVLAVLVVVALAQAPVQSYLRYYSLLVLGDTERAFDLVADVRDAVES